MRSLAVAFFCVSLMTDDAENLSMCLLATCLSLLEKRTFKSFVHIFYSNVFFIEL